ncbi:ArgE/DapE family deacylase [Lactobacillus sp. CC-MHH1034]|uniref:ArgE/DapE family deacylase n=1 Tax=Agrilactobacillus fermenti TaxID=2586909 RepID=UPI001E43A51C|nr:ArgE/DapE family deacylase [Agrilactobacillus fermenti]MCD2256321.1 ArgE/DapE family deacylase [Agrilactobacillus fermenti]
MTPQEKRINLLIEILKIPTIAQNEGQVATVLANFLTDKTISATFVEYAPGRNNLIIDFNNPNGDKPTLALSGHLDVVATGDTTKWRHQPFSAQIDQDRIYGRGATDMKAGVAAMTMAAKELLTTDFHDPLRLIFTVGEEIDNYGARQLTKAGYLKPVTAMIIGEPTNHDIWFAHKGIIDFTAESIGKTAHGAMPQLGINAIQNLLDYYNQQQSELAPLLAQKDPDLGYTTANVTLIHGGEQINTIPGTAKLRGNIRTVTRVPNEKIAAALQKAATHVNAKPHHQIKVQVDSTINAVKTDANQPFLKTLQAIVQAQGWSGALVTGAPITDAAIFQEDHHFPFAIFGPGNNTAHQVDEYVTISDYLTSIDIYKQIIVSYYQSN